MNDIPGGTPQDGPDGASHGGPDDLGEHVGSVGEEAAKLFGALSDWTRDHGPDLGPHLGARLGPGLSGLATQAASAAREFGEHVDTGSAECSRCPLCRTVHVVRETSPEVREHLASAAASLMQAAAGVLAAAARSGERPGRAGVEKIDLDGDDDWPEDEL